MVLRQIPFAPGELNFAGGPSPDGRYVAFSDATTGDLTLLELASGRKWGLTEKGSWKTSAEMMRTASFSPDGNRIAYGWHLSPSSVDLRVINADGSNRRVIYTDARTEHIEVYEWTPDARRVLTGMWRSDGTCQIAFVSVSDGSVRVLKSFPREQAWKASLSPDGRSSKTDIYVASIDAAGGARSTEPSEVSTQFVGRNDSPEWSPDGEHLAYISQRTALRSGVGSRRLVV